MDNSTIIKKIPGKLYTDKKQKDGHIDDLSKMTKPELLDLLQRQKKLLANKGFVNKLADKGEKLVKLKNEIERELKKWDESEKLSALMERLNVNGKDGLDALEWTGNCAPGYITTRNENKEINVEIEDEDDLDPLKILVSHSGAGFHKKQQRILKPEEPLIRPSDIADNELYSNDSNSGSKDIVEDEYARILCRRLDNSSKTKERFLPHRTLKSTSKQEKEKKLLKFWEVTAATPPPPVHGDTKMVSLEESIKLQHEQQQKLMEIQMKHATERLAVTKHLRISSSIPKSASGYREHAASSSSEDEDSEHEQEHDDEDEDRGGDNIVVYNLVD